jgi:hypothetical protein
MSTSSTVPACPAPGSISSPGLIAPNVTVTSARTAGPSTAPVSASMPLGKSTATTVAPACRAFGPGREPGERLAQAAVTADAEQAVNDQVGPGNGMSHRADGCVAGVIGHPAARLAQRGGAAGGAPWIRPRSR